MAAPTLDDEILTVGREVAGRFPSAARRPMKALDDKAMDLASQDEELRAALFRRAAAWCLSRPCGSRRCEAGAQQYPVRA